MKKVQIYCDGSCNGNGKKENEGGWGFYFLELDNNDNIVVIKSDNERVKNTTNNQMELTAAINGCIYCLKYMTKLYDEDWLCEVYTDSAYIYQCMSQKWYINWIRNGWRNAKKEPVKNKELWEQLIPFFENKHFKFLKVAGHNGIEWNEKADKLARGME